MDLVEAVKNKLIESEDMADKLIDSILSQTPEDYDSIIFDSRLDFVLGTLKDERKILKKYLKSGKSKYTDTWLQSNLEIVESAIDKVTKMIQEG